MVDPSLFRPCRGPRSPTRSNSELPTAATAQASSALRQRPSLHISVHSTTRVKCLSFIESTVCRDSKPSFIIRKCHHHDYKLNFVHIFISNNLEPSESGNISPTKRIRQHFRAIRIRIRQGPSSHQNRLNMPKLISECVNSFQSLLVWDSPKIDVGRRAV